MSNKVSFTFIANNKWSKTVKKIDASTTKLRRKFNKLGGAIKKMGLISSKVRAGFVSNFAKMAAAVGGVFAIRGFITKGAQFQDAMADLSAITGAAGKDLDVLQSKMFSMGKASAISSSNVAEAFKLVASAKPDLLSNLDALAATTKEVLLLKNAAGIELSEAANITAQGLNIFGASADQANRFVNVLAAGAKLGSSEIRETGEAMLIAGPAARAAGLNFESLNAALQTTAIGGIKGSRAGTALNTIFGRLRRQGFDFKELGLEGVFGAIGKQLEAIKDPTERAKKEAKFFGEEHSKVGLALVTNASHLSKFERVLKGTNIAQEQADIRLNTFNARLRKFGVTFSEKIIKMFERLEPLLAKSLDGWGKFIDNMGSDEINNAAKFLGGLVTVMGVLLDVGKMVAAVFNGIGTAIGEAVAQIATLNFSVGTGFKDAFSIGGKLLGLFGGDDESINKKTAGLSGGAKNQTDVNVNLRAPENVIGNIKSKTTGKANGLNVGVNMATAQ